MLLGDHADESVELVDSPVDGLEARRDRRAADADDRGLARRRSAESDDVAVVVEKADEVEDVRIVDRVVRVDLRIGREQLRGLSGDVRERGLRSKTVRAPHLAVAPQTQDTAPR